MRDTGVLNKVIDIKDIDFSQIILPGCRNPNIILNVAVYMLYMPLLVACVKIAMEIEELINNLLYYSFAVII